MKTFRLDVDRDGGRRVEKATMDLGPGPIKIVGNMGAGHLFLDGPKVNLIISGVISFELTEHEGGEDK